MSPLHTSGLPKDFLRGAPPTVTATRVDFATTALPEYEPFYAILLDDVLSREESQTLLSAAEAHGDGLWEQAMINIGGGRQILALDTRNCGRIIWDEAEIAELLWERVTPYIQDILLLENRPDITGSRVAKRGEKWKATRLNERLRFLKYEPGQYFKPHCDGSYITPDKKEISYFTLHLYLNDSASNSAGATLKGGETTFHSFNMKKEWNLEPKMGQVLIFQHAHLLHSGNDVKKGYKFTMRTDIMYEQV